MIMLKRAAVPAATPTVLKRIRQERNLTQREVAALFKPPIDPSLIQLWETGRRAIPPHRLEQLSAILDIPRDLPIATSTPRPSLPPTLTPLPSNRPGRFSRFNQPIRSNQPLIASIAAPPPSSNHSNSLDTSPTSTFVQVGYCLEPCHCPRYHCLICDAYTTELRHKCQ